jgi:hypothetical protein
MPARGLTIRWLIGFSSAAGYQGGLAHRLAGDPISRYEPARLLISMAMKSTRTTSLMIHEFGTRDSVMGNPPGPRPLLESAHRPRNQGHGVPNSRTIRLTARERRRRARRPPKQNHHPAPNRARGLDP